LINLKNLRKLIFLSFPFLSFPFLSFLKYISGCGFQVNINLTKDGYHVTKLSIQHNHQLHQYLGPSEVSQEIKDRIRVLTQAGVDATAAGEMIYQEFGVRLGKQQLYQYRYQTRWELYRI